MENSFKNDVKNYPLYFLLWTCFGFFYFSQGLTQRLVFHDPIPWWRYLVAWLIGVYIWALLTPAILWLGRRFAIEHTKWLLRTALHLFFSAGFSILELVLENALYLRLQLFPYANSDLRTIFTQVIVRGFHGGVLDYWIVLGLQSGVLYYHRYRERSQELLQFQLRASELQSQLVSAQLNVLKMQLQPHFLFNTLNAIMVLVRQQKSRDAEEMLGHLSDLLRGVLEDLHSQEVSLRRELEYLRLYLSIERVRFADRMKVEIQVDPATEEASVPQLILQPLVENAVRHGIGRSSSAGTILIQATTEDGGLEIKIQDDGPGFHADPSSDREGIGLANTRARLKQIYGEEASITIENGSDRGAIVTMRFPFRRYSEVS